MRHRFNSTWILSTLVISTLLLSGCSTNRATGKQSFTAFMSEEDEARIGAEEHPKMLQAFGGTYDDAALEAYVRAIGRDLVAQSELPDMEFQFFVLNDDTVNAFALPGGYVYISRGLIALCEDEAELAGVIGHEIGHVTARHSAQRHSSAQAANIGLTAIGILESIFGVPTGLNNVVSFGAQAALQSYSRNQELEADRLGARYMSRAGYSPAALTDFFAKLDMQNGIEADKAGKSIDNYSVMSTHPRTSDRIEQAQTLARTNIPKGAKRERALFLSQVDGLIFGKDPKEGLMRGDSFVHPKIGFQFTFPPNFTVENGKSAVTGSNGKDTKIVFDMENPNAATGFADLTDYISKTWASNAKITTNDVQRLTINGLDAATATANVNTNQGARDLRMLAIRGNRDQIFRFLFATAPSITEEMSLPLRRVSYSFRILNPDEATNISAPRIRLHKVKSGETENSLANKMPLGKFNDDWFKALNLNELSNGLKAGGTVKIVKN